MKASYLKAFFSSCRRQLGRQAIIGALMGLGLLALLMYFDEEYVHPEVGVTELHFKESYDIALRRAKAWDEQAN